VCHARHRIGPGGGGGPPLFVAWYDITVGCRTFFLGVLLVKCIPWDAYFLVAGLALPPKDGGFSPVAETVFFGAPVHCLSILFFMCFADVNFFRPVPKCYASRAPRFSPVEYTEVRKDFSSERFRV